MFVTNIVSCYNGKPLKEESPMFEYTHTVRIRSRVSLLSLKRFPATILFKEFR